MERGVFSNSALFLRSLDGGLTWATAATVGTTEATGSGSIAFSSTGSYGIAGTFTTLAQAFARACVVCACCVRWCVCVSEL